MRIRGEFSEPDGLTFKESLSMKVNETLAASEWEDISGGIQWRFMQRRMQNGDLVTISQHRDRAVPDRITNLVQCMMGIPQLEIPANYPVMWNTDEPEIASGQHLLMLAANQILSNVRREQVDAEIDQEIDERRQEND
jgi:hypothetical protein